MDKIYYGTLNILLKPLGKRVGTLVAGFIIGTLGVPPETAAAFVAAGVAFSGVAFDVVLAALAARIKAEA
jgi:hypothetical protein